VPFALQEMGPHPGHVLGQPRTVGERDH
jgi:hypothetical protein